MYKVIIHGLTKAQAETIKKGVKRKVVDIEVE